MIASLQQACLDLLARSDRTREEIRSVLIARDFDPFEVDEMLDKLERRGFLKDRRVAERVIETSKDSSSRLRQKLEKRKVEPTVIEEALAEIPFDRELSCAVAILQSRGWKSWAQAARHLAGKGYEDEIVTSACNLVLGEQTYE